MRYQLFQVDSFTDKIFCGNPACVIPLNEWLEDEILLKIARENSVPETAFFIKNGKSFHIRWFTPDLEMDLCGHATLATAFVIHSMLDYSIDEINFISKSGKLKVNYKDKFYYLNFPSRPAEKSTIPKIISNALNIQPLQVFKSRDYMLLYKNEQNIRDINIDREIFDKINLGNGGVIVTAKGDSADFVSRFFTPQSTILEDPVTGSSHYTLIPYWSSRLSKDNLISHQISNRGGTLICKNKNNRVVIGGQAVIFSSGWISL